MKKRELIHRIERKEKCFLREDGIFESETYMNNIHFKKLNPLLEIDNSLNKWNKRYYSYKGNHKMPSREKIKSM